MSSMMEYNGYHATIEYDAEDNLFVGEVFGIADSLNFHGSSIQELETMFQQSVDNYLEMCEKIGKEPNKEFRGTFNVRISPELHRKAAMEAAKQNVTLNQFVSNAIESAFERPKTIENQTVVFLPNSFLKEGYITDSFLSTYKQEGKLFERKETYSYV